MDGGDQPVSPSTLATDFARRVSAPLKTSILKAPPRRQIHHSPSSVTIHRSMRLVAKCASRAPNSTLQALKVLVPKWEPFASQPSDSQVLVEFQQTF